MIGVIKKNLEVKREFWKTIYQEKPEIHNKYLKKYREEKKNVTMLRIPFNKYAIEDSTNTV